MWFLKNLDLVWNEFGLREMQFGSFIANFAILVYVIVE